MARQKNTPPPEGVLQKRSPLNMKASPELRARIEEAAAQNGLSLTQEVERRLIESFRSDDANGGPETNALLKLIGTMIAVAEARTGLSWHSDTDTFFAVEAAIKSIMRSNFPTTWEGWTPQISDALAAQAEAESNMRSKQKELEAFRSAHPELKYYFPMPGEPINALLTAEPQPTFNVLVEQQRISDELLHAIGLMEAATSTVQKLTDPIYERQDAAEAIGKQIGNDLTQQFRVSRQKKL